jgi:predicted nucleotidyltransferase
MNELKSLRIKKNMTQQEAAARIGVSLRSYITYENDESKVNTSKYKFLIHEMESIDPVDEEHGVLSREVIIEICSKIFSQYDVDYCYLFGSYAKGKATAKSDIDFLISGKVTGLKYYELVESLRQALHKKVDLLDLNQVLKNAELLDEVLKEGIKVYG